MTGRKWVMVLAAALVVMLMASAAWAAPGGVKGKPFKVKMKDINGHWGEEVISKMVARGLLNGYEDLSFRPGKQVTNEEVLTMLVRAMGLEDEAQARAGANLNLKHSQQLSPWASGYLAEAVESGLVLPVELASIIPNKPAKRGEVATYLARVLIWAQLHAPAGGTVPFMDASEITTDLMAYVSPVYTWGLMLGDLQHKFQPNKPVTRAEMAIILDRMSDLLENGQDERERISGTLKAITVGASPAIKVEKLAGGQLNVPVAEDAAIYRNNKRVELAELRMDDLVEVILDEGQVVFIAATAPQLVSYVTRTVKSINTGDRTVTAMPDGGSETVYRMASGVQIKLNGDPVSLSALRPGDTVKIYVREDLAIKIDAQRANTTVVKSIISAVVILSTPQVAVKNSAGQVVYYHVADDAPITLDGLNADLQDLRPGYPVELKIRSDQAIEIKAWTFYQVKGSIVSLLIGSPNKMTLQAGDGTQTTYTLSSSAAILVDGVAKPFNTLNIGWTVRATIQDSLVVKIEVDAP